MRFIPDVTNPDFVDHSPIGFWDNLLATLRLILFKATLIALCFALLHLISPGPLSPGSEYDPGGCDPHPTNPAGVGL